MNRFLRKSLRRGAASALHYSGALALSRLFSRLTILMYHRTIDPESVSFPLQSGMYVRPDVFRMQMKLLSRTANVISLTEATNVIRQKKRLPRRSVVITFDDGWLDNKEYAFPVLKELELPATVFLPTSFIGGRDLFWTDAVSVVGSSEQFRKTFLSTLESRALLDRLPRETCQAALQHLPIQSKFREQELEKWITFFFRLPVPQREILLNSLFEVMEGELPHLPRQFLNWQEVRSSLSQQVSFGPHSHRHLLSTELSASDLLVDFNDCVQCFENENIPLLPTYCYPGGTFNDSTQSTLASTRIGFAATTERSFEISAVPALLGRVGIHNDISYSPSLFAARIWGGSRW